MAIGLYSGGLIIGRIFASEMWGAYIWEGLFSGGLIYYQNFLVMQWLCFSDEPCHQQCLQICGLLTVIKES